MARAPLCLLLCLAVATPGEALDAAGLNGSHVVLMRRLPLLPLVVTPLANAAVALAPAAAWAHVDTSHGGGFVAGFLHPISGLDHVVAMVAVGLWGAVLGPPAIWVLPVAFPVVMAFGGLLALLGVPIPGVEIGITVSRNRPGPAARLARGNTQAEVVERAAHKRLTFL